MFNKKELKELNNKYVDLRNMIIDLRDKIDRRTSIIIEPEEYTYCGLTDGSYGTSVMIKEKKVPIKDIIKDLLKTLGYEIICDYHPEKEEYSLKKVDMKKKTKNKKKKVI